MLIGNKTLIIIPCYNEEKRIDAKPFLDFLNDTIDIDLCFVNDGSTDDTSKLLRSHFTSNPKVQLVDYPKNLGKAEAIRLSVLQALKLGRYSQIAFWDADLATPIGESLELLKILKSNNQYQLIVGSRWNRLGARIKRRMIRHYPSRVFATFASITIGLNVYDTQCGSKFFRVTHLQEIMEEPFISRWLFDVELFIRFKKICERENIPNWAVEVPVHEWTEIEGSKTLLKDFLLGPYELLKIARHYKK